MRIAFVVAAVLALSLLAACDEDEVPASAGAEASGVAEAAPEPVFPDVIDADIASDGDGRWTVSATISSPYDSPARYADAWRVLDPAGEVLGVRELAHDHASEQPFTRSLTGVEIPDDVRVITIEGRDQVSGWGGATVELEIPRP